MFGAGKAVGATEKPYVLAFYYNTAAAVPYAVKMSLVDGSVIDAVPTAGSRYFDYYGAAYVPSIKKYVGMVAGGTGSGHWYSYDPDTYTWTALDTSTNGNGTNVTLMPNENVAGGYSQAGIGDAGVLSTPGSGYIINSKPVFDTNSQNFWPVISNNSSFLWTCTGNGDLRKNTVSGTTLTKAATFRTLSSDGMSYGALAIGQDSNLYVTSYDKVGKYPLTGGNTPATAVYTPSFVSGVGASTYYSTSTDKPYIVISGQQGGVWVLSESSFTRSSYLSSGSTGLTGVRAIKYVKKSSSVVVGSNSDNKICVLTMSSGGTLSPVWSLKPTGYTTLFGMFVKDNPVDWMPV